MDERGLVTCPGDEKRHRGHDVASVAQSHGVGQEGDDDGRTGGGQEDTRKHTGDVHCILDIVDVGCDTRVELAPEYIPEPKNWQSHGKCMAWNGTARRCGCACAFWGNLNLACWVVPRRLPRAQGLGKERSKQPKNTQEISKSFDVSALE